MAHPHAGVVAGLRCEALRSDVNVHLYLIDEGVKTLPPGDPQPGFGACQIERLCVRVPAAQGVHGGIRSRSAILRISGPLPNHHRLRSIRQPVTGYSFSLPLLQTLQGCVRNRCQSHVQRRRPYRKVILMRRDS